MIGTGIVPPAPAALKLVAVQYAPCPVCKNLMNRVNFAHSSGVIVDVCTRHGTWFDQDELREVLEFISGGGLEAARARELRQTPASLPTSQGLPTTDDPWRIVRPILDGDNAKLILNAVATFTSRRKL
jgi:Zn-finger nucleic acid-binding protein